MARGSSVTEKGLFSFTRHNALDNAAIVPPVVNMVTEVFGQQIGRPRVNHFTVWSKEQDPEEWERQSPGVFAFFRHNGGTSVPKIFFSPYYTELLAKMATGKSTPEENFAAIHILVHELLHSLSGINRPDWRDNDDLREKVCTPGEREYQLEEGLVEALARLNTIRIAETCGYQITPAYLTTSGSIHKPIYSKLGPYPLQSRMMTSLGLLMMGHLDTAALKDGKYDQIYDLKGEAGDDARAALTNWLMMAPGSQRRQAIGGQLGMITKCGPAEMKTLMDKLQATVTDPDYNWTIKVKERRLSKKREYLKPVKSYDAYLAETLDPLTYTD